MKKGDVIEFNGKRFVAMYRDVVGWLFSPTRKDGKTPDKRQELQRFTSTIIADYEQQKSNQPGRPPTLPKGTKLRGIRLTSDEFAAVKEFVKELRTKKCSEIERT